MAIYNSDPLRAENDRVLHNAMVCFHDGKSVGLAIAAFETLEKYYPTSPLLPQALQDCAANRPRRSRAAGTANASDATCKRD